MARAAPRTQVLLIRGYILVWKARRRKTHEGRLATRGAAKGVHELEVGDHVLYNYRTRYVCTSVAVCHESVSDAIRAVGHHRLMPWTTTPFQCLAEYCRLYTGNAYADCSTVLVQAWDCGLRGRDLQFVTWSDEPV